MTTDIVIPVYGGADFLKRCLVSLMASIGSTDAQVYLVDDATPPDRQEGLEEIYASLPARCHLIRNKENLGFSGTNNVGVGKGKSPYVCLLNSDTEPHSGWLQNMEKVLDDHPEVGIVGARLTFPLWSTDRSRPKGKIQHAGVVFNVAKQPYHIFMGWDANHPKVSRSHADFKAVTGACMMTRRYIYEKVGGLSEKYEVGNFEDIDYCMKVVTAKLKVYYCAEARLAHYGSGSGNVAAVERNAQIFIEDWQDRIKNDDWRFW